MDSYFFFRVYIAGLVRVADDMIDGLLAIDVLLNEIPREIRFYWE